MTEYVSQNAAGRSPAVDLPDVAKSAGWLAEWMLDRPISREAEDNAETVTAFLRRLTMPCPDFCQTNHAATFDIEQELRMRNHEVVFPPIRSGERTVASVSVVLTDDLTTGERTGPVVMTEVGDGLTPAQTREYTDQLQLAQALAATGSSAALAPAAEIAEEELRRQDHAAFRATLGEDTGLFDEAKQKTPCPDWCVIDHTKQYEEYVRECSTGGEEIPTSGGTISASVVQFTDFLSGTRKAPQVRIGDIVVTPDNAFALAEQIREAGVSALAPMLIRNKNRGQNCATWCVDENGGCEGECMGNPTDVLASAGYKAYTDGGGIRVGLAESYPIITEDRHPAVCVKVSGPIDPETDKEAWVEMTPAEARRHAAAILHHADAAESA